MPDLNNTADLVVPVSSLGLAAAAVYRAGSLGTKVENHAERLNAIEEEQKRSVTRGELDARFQTLDARIGSLDDKIDMVLDLLGKERK